MTDLTTESQQLIQRFSSRADVSQKHTDNLRALLKDSPALVSQFNDAVAAGHVTEIAPLTNPHAGGEYNPQTKVISLPLSQLEDDPNGVFNPSEMTFVLGHELQHGLNRDERTLAYQEFQNTIHAKAQESGTPRDYTDASMALISADRRDEAGAQIAGWNAVLSMVKTTHPAPSLEQIYDAHPNRMSDFIDRDNSKTPYTYSLKGNLALNDDLSMPFSEANLEGMGSIILTRAPVIRGLVTTVIPTIRIIMAHGSLAKLSEPNVTTILYQPMAWRRRLHWICKNSVFKNACLKKTECI